ncbi:MAG: T9SS type A sorting domain-containing protein [Candidatus Kapaibacteriota bacterium]
MLTLDIFPNPSSDKISLDLGGVEIADLVVYDILGNEILSIPNYSNKSEIDIINYSIDTYTIQIQTSTGNMSQRLLVNS